MSNQQVNPYPIRLPKELREKLEAVAKANGRSLNAEMLLRLEASLREEEGNTEKPTSRGSDYITKREARELMNASLRRLYRHLIEAKIINLEEDFDVDEIAKDVSK